MGEIIYTLWCLVAVVFGFYFLIKYHWDYTDFNNPKEGNSLIVGLSVVWIVFWGLPALGRIITHLEGKL